MSGPLNEWVDGSLGDDGVLINSQSAAGRSPQPRILLTQGHDSYLRWGQDRRLNGWIIAPLTWAPKRGFLGQPTGYAAQPGHTFSEILTRRQRRSFAHSTHQTTKTRLGSRAQSVRCAAGAWLSLLTVIEQVMQTFSQRLLAACSPVLQHNQFYLALLLGASCGVIQQHRPPILLLMDTAIDSPIRRFDDTIISLGYSRLHGCFFSLRQDATGKNIG